MNPARILPCIALALAACTPTPASKIALMVPGDASELAHYEALAAEFQRQNPNVRVEITHIPAAGDYRTRLAAGFAAGAPPDLFFVNYQRLAPWVEAGQIEPLESRLAASHALKEGDFYAQALAPLRHNGKLMCLPVNASSPVIFYNKALFDQAKQPHPRADWRWEDFVSAAKATTGPNGQHGFGTEIQLFRLAPFVWSNGGRLTGAEDDGFALDDPLTLQAIQRYLELSTVLKVAPNQRDERAEDSLTRFVKGRLAMLMDSRRVVPAFRAAIGDGFDWDVAPLPNMGTPASILHSEALCMSATAADKAAAWRFIELSFSDRFQTALAETGRTVPALPRIANSAAFLAPGAKPANSRVWLDALPVLRAVPAHKNWPAIESAFNKEIEGAYYGLVPLTTANRAIRQQTAGLFAR